MQHWKVQHLKVCQKTSCSFTKMHCGRAAASLSLWRKTTMQTLFAALWNSLAPKLSIERGKCGGSVACCWLQRRRQPLMAY